jgi:hypothetical protein
MDDDFFGTEARQRTRSKALYALRKRLPFRDGAACIGCGAWKMLPELQRAHITPCEEFERHLGSEAGILESNRDDNIVPMCRGCHRQLDKPSVRIPWNGAEPTEAETMRVAEAEYARWRPIRLAVERFMEQRGWHDAEEVILPHHLSPDGTRASYGGLSYIAGGGNAPKWRPRFEDRFRVELGLRPASHFRPNVIYAPGVEPRATKSWNGWPGPAKEPRT